MQPHLHPWSEYWPRLQLQLPYSYQPTNKRLIALSSLVWMIRYSCLKIMTHTGEINLCLSNNVDRILQCIHLILI